MWSKFIYASHLYKFSIEIFSSNSVKDNVGGELFFTLVKNNEHYCGGTEKGVTFLQTEVPWLPYSFIGYIQKPSESTIVNAYVWQVYLLCICACYIL